MMPRWSVYACLALGIFALGYGTALGVTARRASAKAAAAQTQSDQHEGAAQTHAAQAAKSDRQGAANQAAVSTADAQVAAAKRELADLQARLPKTAPVSISVGDKSSPTPNLPEIPDSSVVAQRDAYKAAYEQALVVIAAGDEALKAQKLQTSIEHASAVQWHAAYDESQKALALKGIAMDAAVRSERASGIKSQLIHVGEAAIAAYLIGRAH